MLAVMSELVSGQRWALSGSQRSKLVSDELKERWHFKIIFMKWKVSLLKENVWLFNYLLRLTSQGGNEWLKIVKWRMMRNMRGLILCSCRAIFVFIIVWIVLNNVYIVNKDVWTQTVCSLVVLFVSLEL